MDGKGCQQKDKNVNSLVLGGGGLHYCTKGSDWLTQERKKIIRMQRCEEENKEREASNINTHAKSADATVL